MTASNGNAGGPSAHELALVHVSDAINPALAGHGQASYLSPPHPRDEALMLARLLLGWPPAALEGETRWRCAVAGGTRTVTLRPAGIGSHDGNLADARAAVPPRPTP